MMLRRKKILITGSAGFIGSNLLPKLRKYNIITYDKRDGKDIFDNEFEKAVKKADVVYHLAAQVSVEKSHKKPSETFIINVLGTARVVELCVKYKKKLIYPSSAAIYEPNSSPYAWSKYLAEEIVWGVRGKIPVVILRLFNVYGKGGKGVMYNFSTDQKITINGDGEQKRDFISVKDVCSILEDALKNKWNGVKCDVGTGEAIDLNYIAKIFMTYRKKKKIYYRKPVLEIRESKADIQLLNKLYRENLTTNLEVDLLKLI